MTKTGKYLLEPINKVWILLFGGGWKGIQYVDSYHYLTIWNGGSYLEKDNIVYSMGAWKKFRTQHRLVPDDTVHKGTSKNHKTDGKSTNFVVNIYSSIFWFL